MSLICNNIAELKTILSGCATSSNNATNELSVQYHFDKSIVNVFATGAVTFQGKNDETLKTNVTAKVNALNVLKTNLCEVKK